MALATVLIVALIVVASTIVLSAIVLSGRISHEEERLADAQQRAQEAGSETPRVAHRAP